MSQTSPIAQITGQMFLYEKPELLSREEHGNYGINPIERPFAFCAKIRAVPLVISEIPAAARHYPIVFHELTNMVPLAVLGIVDDVNLFVDDKGVWDQHAYIPAYVRRYPFAVAAETGSDRMAIVIDRAYGGLAVGAQAPFFTGGEPTDATRQMIDFCQGYENDRRVTDQFLKELEALDLVTPQQAQYTPTGKTESLVFANYYGVDENKLRDLADDKFIGLRRNGLLNVVHAQLWSMDNWRQLIQRRSVRYGLTEENLFEPVRLS